MCLPVDNWTYYLDKNYFEKLRIVFPHPVDVSHAYSEIEDSDKGGVSIIKRFLVNNFYFFATRARERRKKWRWEGKMKNMTIDSRHPTILFR